MLVSWVMLSDNELPFLFHYFLKIQPNSGRKSMIKHTSKEKTEEASIESSNKIWHLAQSDAEERLSGLEFLLWRLFYSFKKWHEDCQSCVSNDDVNADEIALIHLIRMRDRPKTIYEIARLMNRDDMPNLQYSLKKLIKLNIIQKSKEASKRAISYEVTAKGRKITDRYGEIRREIMVKLLKNNNEKDWDMIYSILSDYMNTYNEASRTAALSRTNNILIK